MKKVIFALILFFMADKMAAQESQTAYNFLRLPVSAHAAALGGDNITLINDDAWLMFNNPALLSSVSDKTLALNYMNFMRGVNLAGVAYNKVIKERASAALSVNYVDYGKMRYTTADNQDLGELSDNQIGFMRQHIGIVFQDHKILYDRNVLQNVILPLRIIGYQPRKAEERARIAIEKVGLKGRELDDPVTLSGGEQQRLCIARAVVHQPSLLIADEPSANLDRAYALDIMELFKTFHEAGTTVIVAAHDETLMADYGHRILRLSKGRLA